MHVVTAEAFCVQDPQIVMQSVNPWFAQLHVYPRIVRIRTLLITYVYICTCTCQWNLSNPDSFGTEESVLISEVSWFQVL